MSGRIVRVAVDEMFEIWDDEQLIGEARSFFSLSFFSSKNYLFMRPREYIPLPRFIVATDVKYEEHLYSRSFIEKPKEGLSRFRLKPMIFRRDLYALSHPHEQHSSMLFNYIST